ncbi:MAG: WavE lipopolysaccharide synthesis family protein [Chthoniobacteraceae bacterium]
MSISRPKPADISVVVQGPILPYAKSPTESTAAFIRKTKQILPGAEIVVSTWKGSDLAEVEADRVVLNDDPGDSRRVMGGKLESCSNINRHLVSAGEGLKAATRPFSIKLRSDSWLTHTGFIDQWCAYPARKSEHAFFKQRIVLPTAISVNPDRSDGRLFHLSDLFYFGQSEDLQEFWSGIPLFKDPPPETDEKDYAVNELLYLTAEQYILTHALRRKFPISYRSLQDATPQNRQFFETLLANNFVMAKPADLGVAFAKWRFLPHAIYDHYTQGEWLRLYCRHCDPTVRVPVDWDLLLQQFLHKLPFLKR